MKMSKKSIISIAAILLGFTLMFVLTGDYIKESVEYKDTFYIGYSQFPGAAPSYRAFKRDMTAPAPAKYDGLEHIGWFYYENGELKKFIPSEFTPPEDGDNWLQVFGRWRSVEPQESKDAG